MLRFSLSWILLLSACFIKMCSPQSNNDASRNLEHFLYIYNEDGIDYYSLPLADSLFLTEGIDSQLIYLVDGSCSVCIGKLIQFLDTEGEQLFSQELTIVPKNANGELLKYHLDNHEGNLANVDYRIVIPFDYVNEPDGLYLCRCGVVVKSLLFE